jgi:hypothetical protein
MRSIRVFTLLFSLFAGIAEGRSQTIRILPDIALPKDSVKRIDLLIALNGFLLAKEGPNKENPFVLPSDLPAASLLLDEFKGMDNGAVYLTNLSFQSDSSFLVQCSYITMSHDTPVLHASFSLLAIPFQHRYFIMSPLNRNTKSWKQATVQNFLFKYRDSLDILKATEYVQRCTLYENKLRIAGQQEVFFVCDDFHDALRLSGVDYKREYNGFVYNSLTSHENGVFLTVSGTRNSGFGQYDPHDLWHEKLRAVVSQNTINRPVDEGCAYLYGGSWGMSWDRILQDFMRYANAHPKADWLELYKSNAFFETGSYKNLVANMINALLVEHIETARGFAPVMELIQCGKRQQGDANYFAALQKITGITGANFNENVDKLISQKQQVPVVHTSN